MTGTIFAAANTVQAYQEFQQNHQRILAGDVNAVSPWMTVPYIARVYHVPATCLDGSLHITDPFLQKRASLAYIAEATKRRGIDLIHTVQKTILNYRKKRMPCTFPGAHPTPGAVEGGTI
jgi:hypothetical protein